MKRNAIIEFFLLNPRYSFKVFAQKTAVHNGPLWMVTAWTDWTTSAAQCPRLDWNNMARFTVTGMRWYSSEFYGAPVKSTLEVDDGSYVIPPGRSQTEDWSQTLLTGVSWVRTELVWSRERSRSLSLPLLSKRPGERSLRLSSTARPGDFSRSRGRAGDLSRRNSVRPSR